MTKEELLSHFGQLDLTEMQHKEADKFQPVYFFVTDKTKIAKCSLCGKTFETEGRAHMSFSKCPHCQSCGLVVHVWRYKNNYLRNLRRNVMTYWLDRSVEDPDIITCRAIYSMYEVYKDELKVSVVRFTDAYYIFVPGKGGCSVTSKYRWNPDYDSDEDALDNPVMLRKSCTSRHNIYNNRFTIDKLVEVQPPSKGWWQEVSEGTSLQYVCDFYSKYLAKSDRFIELMDKLAAWPLSMEQLGKIGFDKILVKVVEGRIGPFRAFNMRGKNLRQMLRVNVTKADLAYIGGGEFPMDVYQKWVALKKTAKGKDLSLQFFSENFRYCNFTELASVMQYVSYERIIFYLEKQNKKYPKVRHDLNLYTDYIADCRQLELDISSKEVLFPDNLSESHTNLAAQVVCKANEKLNKKYRKRYKKLVEEYAYSGEVYSVVVPDDVTDLVREGNIQHICVGRYMERVANGRTDVVYIRRNTEKETPFCTMEIKDGSIVQVRAKFNGVPPDDAMAFVKTFEHEKLGKAV